MRDQIAQGPVGGIGALGKLQVGPVIRDGAVERENALRVEPGRQQAHIRLGLRGDIDRRLRRHRRPGRGAALAPGAVHDDIVGRHHNDGKAGTEIGKAVEKFVQLRGGAPGRLGQCRGAGEKKGADGREGVT